MFATRIAGTGLIALAVGCSDPPRSNDDIEPPTPTPAAGDDDAGAGEASTTGPSGGSTSGPAEPDATSEDEIIYDVARVPDVPGVEGCGAPSPVQCDDEDDDPFHAIGLNCSGGPTVDGIYNGDPQSIYVHEGEIGTHAPAPFPPREGDKILILSSGRAEDLLTPGLYASTDIAGHLDDGALLPAPLDPTDVSATEDCSENPGLVGTGDCSNTIQTQWDQGGGFGGGPGNAYDYNELRMTVEVPMETTGFSYDLAMFSTEYPDYYQSEYNDMYIAWLESEQWTGNVSFDEAGSPISLNAGFLDYKDAPNPVDCPAPCTSPELAGTAMEGHAGTKWLTTSAPVTPGETIELIFAVFDLSDPVLDTVILLDNWQWNCDGGPPATVPG